MSAHFLSQQLALLQERGLIRMSGEGGKPVVRFKHALTREATYNAILNTRRIEIHRDVAFVLRELYPERDLEMTVTLAEHWLHAQEYESALDECLPRAQDLIYTGRGESLIQLLLPVPAEKISPARQVECLTGLADAYAARGEYSRARELYQDALNMPAAEQGRAKLLYSLGVAAYHLSNNSQAVDFQQQSLELARQEGDIKQQAHASGGLGLAYWNLGDLQKAEENLQLSRSLSMQLGDSTELANAEFNLAGVLLDQAKYSDSVKAAERALEVDQKLGHTTLAARTLQLLGSGYYGLNEPQKAASYYQRSVLTSRELGDELGIALGLGNLGEMYVDLGESEAAVQNLDEAIKILHSIKYDFLLPLNLVGLARVRLKQAVQAGNDNERDELLALAQKNAEEALAVAERLGSEDRAGSANRVLAEVLAARGDLDAALSHAQQATSLLGKGGHALELERAQETYRNILAMSSATVQPAG